MTDPIIPVTQANEKADLPPRPAESLSTINPPMDTSAQMMGYNTNNVRNYYRSLIVKFDANS